EGLTYPFEQFAQRNAEADAFWHKKNAAYIARMKSVKSKADPKKTVYELRLDELKPIWERVAKDTEAKKKNAEEQAKIMNERYTKLDKEVKKLQADLKKDDPKLVAAETELEGVTRLKTIWDKELEGLTQEAKDSSTQGQEKAWLEKDAYINDAFRLVYNPKLCL